MQEEMINQLVNDFCTNNYQAIKTFVQSLPDTENTRNALTFFDGTDPFYIIVALDGLSAGYYFTRDYLHAHLFAFTTYYCVQKFLEAPFTQRKDEILYYAGSSTYYILQIFLNSGDYDKGLLAYEAVVTYYKEKIEKEEFISARLTAVDFHLCLNQTEEARSLFAQIAMDKLQPYNKIYYDSLAEKLRRLFSEVSQLPAEATLQKAAQLQTDLQNIVSYIESAIQNKTGQPSEKETAELKEIQALITQIRNCRDDNELLELCSNVSNKINNWFSGDKQPEGENLNDKRMQVQTIANTIYGSEDDNVLKTAIGQLQQLLPFFEKKYPADENLVYWMMATCHDWLGNATEAITYLEKLHESLEDILASITDEKERGGVFNQYPYLFNLLVRNYYIAGDTHGVLKAMEASKGRILSAVSFAGNAMQAYHQLPEDLAALLAKENAHFLGFFVDEKFTVSILLTNKGKYYGKGISISQEEINNWTAKEYQNPANWNNASLGLFGSKKKIDMSIELEKFLPVLQVALSEGTIKKGDHIVYAQDENFMLFPLHYAKFMDAYLIEHFSLSRIHNAFQLLNLMQEAEKDFTEIAVFSAPASQDAGNVEKMQAFHAVQDWLTQHTTLPVHAKAADIQQLPALIQKKSLIHFATHGVFPNSIFEDAKKNNPFYNSGILLNAGEAPPHLDVHFDYYKMENLLNPDKLLQLGLLFAQCHISLQACVSGRSREGIGGDAIGMEWATFFAGAQSMLSAAWDIDIFWVNKFFIAFYDYWLNKKMTKAAAYAATMRDLLKNKFPEEKPNVYFWGGMILSGNWKT